MDVKIKILWGSVKFRTGGRAREPFRQIRFNSGADSKVWMRRGVEQLAV